MVNQKSRGITRGVVVAMIAGLMAHGSATAQTTAAPAPATPPAIPAVQQPEPPASQLAAARDLVVSSGMARSFSPMVPQLMDQVIPLFTKTRPELKPGLTVVLQQLQPEFVKKGDEMIDIAAHIYARRMSEAELKDAAAFFSSPTGKKYVESQPQTLDELVVAMQSFTQTLSTFMMERIHAEMKAKGQDF